MMRKIFKYMSAFSLWLSVITLSAHQIIPHDHHLADPYSKQDNNCPASNSKSSQKSGLPLHCHAFNDLASEKLRTFHISQNIQFILISFSNLSDTSAFELHVSCVSIIDFLNPIFDSFVLDHSLLRAPPFSA